MKKKPKLKIDTIEGLAAVVVAGFEAVDQRFEKMDRRFDAMDRRFVAVDRRFDAMDEQFVAIDRRFDGIEAQLSDIKVEVIDIRKQLDVLEATAHNHAGYAKEIDHLLRRVGIIERHLQIHAEKILKK